MFAMIENGWRGEYSNLW